MSITKLSIALGLEHNALHMVRYTNPDKFKYIFALDDDPIRSYQKYLDVQETLINECIDAYYFLVERRKMSELARRLVDGGVLVNSTGFSTHMSNAIFRIEPVFYAHKSFLKYQKVIVYAKKLIEEIKENEK